MADQRRLKSIGARYDIDVSRHPDPWRRIRSRLSWIFGLGTIVACIPWVMGNHRAFESECVSDAHRPFGHNCQECHDRRFVPLARMITFSNKLHSTSDQACQKCHRETNTDHLSADTSGIERLAALETQLKSAFDSVGCAGCHGEHLGKSELAQVANASCTNCHAAVHEGIADRKFELSFSDFSHHPEFAIWRVPHGTGQKPKASDAPAVDTPDAQPAAVPTGQRTHNAPRLGHDGSTVVDQTAIKFNHHRHLDPELRGSDGKPVELRCGDCHQQSPSGDYFQPISFEQHCHKCHRIGVPEAGDLPHANPEIIRGILLDRLAKNSKPEQRPEDALGGPTKQPIDNASSPKELVASLKDRLTTLEERLFVPPVQPVTTEGSKSLLQSACSKCHVTEAASNETVGWKVVPPDLPNQWMPHSHFRHDRHASVDCSLCHTRNGGPAEASDRSLFYPHLSDELKQKSSSIYASVSATDVLLPRMNVCVNCHGSQSATQASVTDKCVDCHSYHHVPASRPVPPRIRELFGTGTFGVSTRKPIDSTGESNR